MRLHWIHATLCTAGIAGLLILAATVAGGEGEPGSAEARPIATPVTMMNPFAADGLQDPSAEEPAVDVGKPVAIRIPSLEVESTLEALTVGAAGGLSAPVDFDRAGWYAGGPAPGEIGPAIVAGHVDSPTGPAIFYRLAELSNGDEIIIDTDTGDSLTFAVTGRMQSAKATFPTADVYSNVPGPQLRLITCAGFFDRSIGHYTDNLIVFASLIDQPQ